MTGCHIRKRRRICPVPEKSCQRPLTKEVEGYKVSPSAVMAPVIPIKKTPTKPTTRTQTLPPPPFNLTAFPPEDHQAVSVIEASNKKVLTRCTAIEMTRPMDASCATQTNSTRTASVSACCARGITSPFHRGQCEPHPAPEPVARSYAPHKTTVTL